MSAAADRRWRRGTVTTRGDRRRRRPTRRRRALRWLRCQPGAASLPELESRLWRSSSTRPPAMRTGPATALAGDDPKLKGGSSERPAGFTLQELEVAFQAVVDPFFRADVFLTIPNLKELEVEEAVVTTTSLPRGLPGPGRHLPLGVRPAERPAPAPPGFHAPPADQRGLPGPRRSARPWRPGVLALPDLLLPAAERGGLQRRPPRRHRSPDQLRRREERPTSPTPPSSRSSFPWGTR